MPAAHLHQASRSLLSHQHLLQDKHAELQAEHDTVDDMPLAARLHRISSLTQRGSCASSPPTAEPQAAPKPEVKQPKGEVAQPKGELKQVSERFCTVGSEHVHARGSPTLLLLGQAISSAVNAAVK